ncbi:MAG: UDP-glucose 4-epimerase GalE [Clostridiales bacterium]|nr:UDP-glucose 4-epimerase GalE [Clostridiales bacterium]
MTILVTGGAGYIGSHLCLALLEQGHGVVAVDNFCNSGRTALQRVAAMAGAQLKLYDCDVRNGQALLGVFDENRPIGAVVHLAGLKSAGEAIRQPVTYYENNLGGTLTLLRVMAMQGVRRLLFSSSAAVYGPQPQQPVREDMPLLPAASPYGRTKAAVEGMLRDVAGGDAEFSAVLLRYFNAAGAHPSGELGEDAGDAPANLLPALTGAASGRLKPLTVHGGDYDTPDGTALRDYIHVCDLADGHVRALSALERPGVHTFNLGGGRPVSVLELIGAFERVSGVSVPYELGPRRPGDLAACWADTALARAQLGFEAVCSIEDICRDAWRFERQNPGGYGKV